MNTLVIFAAVLTFANAGIVSLAPLSATTILEGPSSSASIVGPDGSSIISATPGGRIVASEDIGLKTIGYSAPVVAVPVAPIAPITQINAAPFVAKALVASPLIGSEYPLLAPGSGLEGQWIPDINEKLYDDGTYKREIY